MRRTKWIIFAFSALGEAGKPAFLTQCANTITATSQNLVRISLMSDVPDDAVMRRVEDVMQRDRKFNHTQTCAQMPTCCGDGIDHLGAQFLRKLRQICLRQCTQSVRRRRFIEQWGYGSGH
ncbi:hypothetical protein D3C81_1859280 [compost metagenome]